MPALSRLFHWLFPLLLLLAALPASALDPNDLLPPEKAFAARLEQQGQQLLVHVDIAPGYYLYRDRTRIVSEPAGVVGTPQLPAGDAKQDPYFGLQQVYHQRVTFTVPITATALPDNFTLLATIQGCADAGLCYPPYTHKLKPGDGPLADWLSPAASADDTAPTLSRQQWLGTLFTFLLAGIGMAFTACMYPLLPIVSSMVAGQGQRLNKTRGFVLTFAYVQGLALTYTAVGVIAGKTGSLLTVWLQQPAVILAASALMVVFALGMFDLITIQLPSALQSRLADHSNKLGGGRLASVFAMGALSALLVGPCVAPPLALALGYIGQSGDAVLGGAALYSMAMGLGLPLLLVGTFGGHILPRAGAWMQQVKYTFGVVMLGVAIWMAGPFLPVWLTMLLWAALALGSAWWLLLSRQRPTPRGAGRWLVRLIAAALALAGLLQIVGAATGAPSPRLPLAAIWQGQLAAKPVFQRIANSAELDAALAQAKAAGQPVLLDFYADWCVSCIEMEETTFRHPDIAARMGKLRLLQADVTANNAEHQALLKRFGLYGPPGIMLYNAQGELVHKVIGYQDAGDFAASLDKVGR
jgi:thiol:disulfide interchange protein DsbD